MSKTIKLTHPSFISGQRFGYLKTIRGSYQLIPSDNTYHAPIIDIKKCQAAKSWFPFKTNNDILITAYPKCGHHLTQKILLEITRTNHNGKYSPELYETADMGLNTAPYIEYYISQSDKEEIEERIELTDNMYPRIWFTHYSFDQIPINNQLFYGNKANKIIVMIRNPKDCIISSWSYFNYIMNTAVYDQDDDNNEEEFSLNDMISYFTRGIMYYGCYFKWYESYWNAFIKNKYNILWLYYEDVIDNPLENVQKVAKFVFDGNNEKNEPQKVLNISDNGYKEILERISFDSVRKDVSENPQTFELGSQFFRRGINNDWKNYFNQYQSELIDETMYFKWAENANGIKYYQQLMQQFNHKYNKNYF